AKPIDVVDELWRRAGLAAEEAFDLPLHRQAAHADGVDGFEDAFLGLAGRIADEPGGAANEDDDLVAAALEVAQRHEPDQAAGVQAGRRWIEADVHRHLLLLEARGKVVGRGLMDEAAPVEFVVDIHENRVLSIRRKPSALATTGQGEVPGIDTI